MCSEQHKTYFFKGKIKKVAKKFGNFKYYLYFCRQKIKNNSITI